MASTIATALFASLLAAASAQQGVPKPVTLKGFTTVTGLSEVFPLNSEIGFNSIGLLNTNYIVVKDAPSRKKCAAACVKRKKCVGFAYVLQETVTKVGSTDSKDVKVPSKIRCRLMTSLTAVQEKFAVDGVSTFVYGDMFIKNSAAACEKGKYFGYHYTSGSAMYDLGCHAFAKAGEDCGFTEGEKLVNLTPPQGFTGLNRDTICAAGYQTLKCLPFYNARASEAAKFTCQDPANPSKPSGSA
eukprot:comp16911_c0_seq1/m.15457 comp16911_c0_seq1/g.15457  ORF comp16911_c0_seq1/g.15457 comp16911_c0_seq1/m.15457 type:complete len:243 (-) comp16911_c0_seq1:349-1077(-)